MCVLHEGLGFRVFQTLGYEMFKKGSVYPNAWPTGLQGVYMPAPERGALGILPNPTPPKRGLTPNPKPVNP